MADPCLVASLPTHLRLAIRDMVIPENAFQRALPTDWSAEAPAKAEGEAQTDPLDSSGDKSRGTFNAQRAAMTEFPQLGDSSQWLIISA